MASITKDRYQGVAVPDSRATIWEDESSGQQAGPHVGQPEANSDNTGRLSLRARRRSLTTALGLVIETDVGGIPAPSSAGRAARFLWRRDSESELRGWDPPIIPAGWEALEYGPSSGDTWLWPVVCVTADGTLLVAYTEDDGSSRAVYARRLVSGTWSSQITVATGMSTSTDVRPSLLALPDGRVHCYYEGDDAVLLAASADDGASWTTWPTTTLLAEGARSLAYNDGQVLCVVDTGASVEQWMSLDGGYSFEQVDTVSSAVSCTVMSAVTRPGFHVVYQDTTASTGAPRHVGIGSAATPLSSATIDNIDTNNSTSGDGILTAAMDDDGTLYAWRAIEYLWQSTDGGASWTQLAQAGSSDGWFQPDGTGWDIYRMRAVMWQGQAVIAHQWTTPNADEDDSVGMLYLGGYTDLNGPVSLSSVPGLVTSRYGMVEHWIPCEEPDTTGSYAVNNVGTSAALTSGNLELTGSASLDYYHYQRTSGLPTHTEAQGGMWGIFTYETSETRGGQPDWNQPLQVSLRLSDGSTTTYELFISADADNLWAFKKTGTSAYTELGSIAIDASSGVRVRWAIYGQNAVVWAQQDTRDTDRNWTGVAQASLANIIGTHTASRVSWGAITDANTFRFREWHLSTVPGFDSGAAASLAWTHPDDLYGRNHSPLGVYIADDVELVSRGGPVAPDDGWTVAAAYDYPYSNLLEDSPRTKWITTDDTGPQSVAYRLSSVGVTYMGSDLLAIPIIGGNVPEVLIEGYNGSSWTSLGTAELAIGPLSYTRYGDSVIGTNASSTDVLLRHGEFDGGYFAFDDADASGKVRSILKTRPGLWGGANGNPVLMLDDVDDTEAASGSNGYIVPASSVVLVSLQGERYEGIRVTIPDPTDASGGGADAFPAGEGDVWRVGVMRPCAVSLWPEDTAWGRVVELDPGVDVDTRRDGTTRTRADAPVRRLSQLSWVDGVDTLYASQDTDDPDVHYIDQASGEPVAWSRTTPHLVQGLVTDLRGPDTCVTLLHRVEPFPESSRIQVLNRRHQFVYGRFTTATPRFESVVGDEGEGEVWRVATLVHREEV